MSRRRQGEAERNAVQIMPKLAEAGITGAGVLRDAIKVSEDQNMSLDKLLTQYDEYQSLIDKRNAGGELTGDEEEALKTLEILATMGDLVQQELATMGPGMDAPAVVSDDGTPASGAFASPAAPGDAPAPGAPA